MFRWLHRLGRGGTPADSGRQSPAANAAQRFEYGLAEHQAGRLASADAAYRNVLAIDPDHVDALHCIGIVAAQRGDPAQAVEWISRALARHEGSPRTHVSLGKAYQAQGRLDRAMASYARARELEPDDFEANLLLGSALAADGQSAPALRRLDDALRCVPPEARAHHALGNAFDELGHFERAASCFRSATLLQPDFAGAHCDLGTSLKALNRLQDAEAAYREALRLDPLHAIARFNLGIVLRERHATAEAVASFRAAIERKPDFAEAYYCLGHTHGDSDEQREARECFRKALSLQPEFAAARWSLAMSCLPSVHGTGEDPALGRREFARELDALRAWFEDKPAALGEQAVGLQQPFALAYQDLDNRDLLRQYGGLCTNLMGRWHESRRIAQTPVTPRSGPIRVGVVSQYFRGHSVWHAIVRGWFAQMDRDRFALQVFALSAGGDSETEFAQSRAASFDAGPKSTLQWLEVIARHAPDVLIYPEIGMDPMACKLASLRLAPIQAATWGHPETTGLPTIDYYLSAEALEPAHAQDHYSERLVLLPGLGCCLERGRAMQAVHGQEPLAIEPEVPLFICAGTPFKYAPQYDCILPELARRTGECRFVFFRYWVPGLTERLEQRLQAAFCQAGLDFHRYVAFVPWQSRPAFHGLMRRAHVYLDSIGFSGFNTAIQSLECDLPIVAMEGRFLRGRLASGLLRRIGLGELVATSLEDYIGLAAQLARDAEHRARVRARLRASCAKIYGDVAPIRALEDFLSAATCRGRP